MCRSIVDDGMSISTTIAERIDTSPANDWSGLERLRSWPCSRLSDDINTPFLAFYFWVDGFDSNSSGDVGLFQGKRCLDDAGDSISSFTVAEICLHRAGQNGIFAGTIEDARDNRQNRDLGALRPAEDRPDRPLR